MSTIANIKLQKIEATVYSTFFTCWQPDSYNEGDTHWDTAYAMTEEYEKVRTGQMVLDDCEHLYSMPVKRKPFPKGEYILNSFRLTEELAKIWYTAFTKYWNSRIKQIGIGGTIKVRLTGIRRPEYYNFETDAAKLKWSMDTTAAEWLHQYICKHDGEFHKFLTYAHGPHDGFKPYPPYTAWDWLDWFTNTPSSVYSRSMYCRDIGLVIGRGFDFVLFGQKDGQFSQATLDEHKTDFRENYWDEEYDESWRNIERKCIEFIAEAKCCVPA
jgi:hypothetical protein